MAKDKKNLSKKANKSVNAKGKSSKVDIGAEKAISALTIIQTENIEKKESKMTKQANNFEDISKDVNDFGKGQMEALTKFSSVWTKGVENVFQTYMTICQEATKNQNKAMQSLIECKTINEVTDAQNKLVQENFDQAVANATKLSEMTSKVATEAFEPINEQINSAIKKATSKAA